MKIELKNLTKVFKNKKNKSEVTAVSNLSIEIKDGELLGLLGPSGCGKSTTLYMISGLLRPSGGYIMFGDEDVTLLPAEKRSIGMVFQNYALYPHMTVLENIMFPLLNLHVCKAEAKDRAYDIAKLVQLESYLDRKPNELSGGQQQRVAIARALVKNPSVLLLDEPLSNLDARLRIKTREEIKRIQQETKITTVFVTHDQEEAMSISDEIVVLKDGLLQQIGRPQEVYDNPCNLFVAKFLGTPPINVFEGEIKNNYLYIANEKIMDFATEDRKVYVGIRPEGFDLDSNGVLGLGIKQIEVLGKDISIVSSHNSCVSDTLRVIVDAEDNVDFKINFRVNIKPKKIYVFDYETEMRIYNGEKK